MECEDSGVGQRRLGRRFDIRAHIPQRGEGTGQLSDLKETYQQYGIKQDHSTYLCGGGKPLGNMMRVAEGSTIPRDLLGIQCPHRN